MPAYMIATYDIEDQDALERYAQAADSLLQRHGGRLLAADVEAKRLEGQGGHVGVVIAFPTQAQAIGFYNDPDYAALKGIRIAATTNTNIVLAGPLPQTSEQGTP